MLVLGLIIGLVFGFVVGAMLARPSAKDLEVLLQYYEVEKESDSAHR